jgi:hypothetical protein
LVEGGSVGDLRWAIDAHKADVLGEEREIKAEDPALSIEGGKQSRLGKVARGAEDEGDA